MYSSYWMEELAPLHLHGSFQLSKARAEKIHQWSQGFQHPASFQRKTAFFEFDAVEPSLPRNVRTNERKALNLTEAVKHGTNVECHPPVVFEKNPSAAHAPLTRGFGPAFGKAPLSCLNSTFKRQCSYTRPTPLYMRWHITLCASHHILSSTLSIADKRVMGILFSSWQRCFFCTNGANTPQPPPSAPSLPPSFLPPYEHHSSLLRECGGAFRVKPGRSSQAPPHSPTNASRALYPSFVGFLSVLHRHVSSNRVKFHAAHASCCSILQ